jgi:hypothetical protein
MNLFYWSLAILMGLYLLARGIASTFKPREPKKSSEPSVLARRLMELDE